MCAVPNGGGMLCERIYVADVEVKPSKNGVLASSAFVTLGVSVRSNKDQIFEAYDDRLFEGIPEHDLEVARSRLTLARDRLAQEIRFLTDVAPARAREMLVGLSGTAHSADALASDLPNLSRINAYAELLTRSGAEFLDHADQAHRDFDPAAAREAIDQTRAASGFSPITDAAWDREIATFLDDHARSYFEGLRKAEDVPGTLARLLEQTGATACQRRSDSRPAWRRKTRPVLMRA